MKNFYLYQCHRLFTAISASVLYLSSPFSGERPEWFFLNKNWTVKPSFNPDAMVAIKPRPNPLIWCIKLSVFWPGCLLSLSTLLINCIWAPGTAVVLSLPTLINIWTLKLWLFSLIHSFETRHLIPSLFQTHLDLFFRGWDFPWKINMGQHALLSALVALHVSPRYVCSSPGDGAFYEGRVCWFLHFISPDPYTVRSHHGKEMGK